MVHKAYLPVALSLKLQQNSLAKITYSFHCLTADEGSVTTL